ncbi:MAG: hypothetical protein N2439_17260, partial [Anaerolineae bacterium]|nr:hypothetical protein [Anaerolineae bacterium]
TNQVSRLKVGQAQYSALLYEHGGFVDDLLVHKVADDHYFLCVNAANQEKDYQHICGYNRFRAEVEFAGPRYVQLALQGPKALPTLAKLTSTDLAAIAYYHFRDGEVAGAPARIARTGYTGEDGFELYVAPAEGPRLFRELLQAGEEFGIRPCGLGARDSLRTEAGFPLHGHELAGPHRVNPIEAGYGAYVRLHKPFFVGRAAARQWHLHRDRRIVRFEVDEKGGKVLRAGSPVLAGRKNEYAGVVTSVVATEERQVGLALIDSTFAREGATVHIVPVTAHDPQPPARSPAELKEGDWVAVPRRATLIDRFMKPGETPLAS